jgi:hypothetical protein
LFENVLLRGIFGFKRDEAKKAAENCIMRLIIYIVHCVLIELSD